MVNDDKKGSWRPVASYSSLAEASIAQGMLEANGVSTRLNNVDFNAIYPMGGAGFGITMLVKSADYDTAMMLLREHQDI